ncbi:TPA: putative bacteriocin export ABC transporter [Clostridioides difficile]
MKSLCSINNINKSYCGNKIISNFSLEIYDGEMIAICGKSGVGKTTLLNLIGLLDKCDSGEIYLFGKNIATMKKPDINKLFRYKISYLFQNYALIENDTIDQNLDIPLTYSKKSKTEKHNLKKEVLETVGLKKTLKTKIYKLSGGEQQKVAIARTLLKSSELILADEPTGSLDGQTRNEILDLLKKLNKQGKTIVIVTHDEHVAKECTKTITL